MGNWALPTLTSTYTNFVSEVNTRDLDLAKGMDPAAVTVTGAVSGMIRWNSANNYWEKYNGTTWAALTTTYAISISGNAATATTATTAGSATSATSATNTTNTAIIDDTTTNATMYPTWVTANTGNLPQKTTSSKLTFNPSTGMLTATGFTGPLTGTATNAVTSATCTGNAATATTATTAGSATSATSATNTTNTTIIDDTTTNATMYLTWVTANTGNLPQKTTSSKLTFNPSTGMLTATGFTGPLTGTATNATNAASAVTCTGNAATASALSATLAVGSGGSGATTLTGLLYGNGTAAFTAASASQIVTAIGSTAVSVSTNIAGGLANQIPYQTGASTTGFITAPATANTGLTWTGSAFTWASLSGTVASGTMYENGQTISANYTITSGKSAMSVGPITINSGVSVTIPSGSRWVVL